MVKHQIIMHQNDVLSNIVHVLEIKDLLFYIIHFYHVIIPRTRLKISADQLCKTTYVVRLN